jgi:hypothetical protein
MGKKVKNIIADISLISGGLMFGSAIPIGENYSHPIFLIIGAILIISGFFYKFLYNNG